MAKERILVVDDEEDILELVKYNLAREGYDVLCAAKGTDGLAIAQAKMPDLIVLDLMLPGMDGLQVCKQLKMDSRTESIPVIMLTAKGEESDIVTGLEVGADDYITKPFSPKVLVARIRTVLRRKQEKQQAVKTLKIHKFIINPTRHEVLVDGKKVELTFTEFSILYALAKRPGIVLGRYQIMDTVKGTDYIASDRAVDVQITGLRKKLGLSGKYIETVRGVGYRFKD